MTEVVLFRSKTTAANPQKTSCLVVIPKIITTLLDIRPGDYIEWVLERESGRIYVRKYKSSEDKNKARHSNDMQ